MVLFLWRASAMGFRVYNQMRRSDRWGSLWALSVYLGLLTYFIHGVLNNYLDTDKASAPFWGFLAILVALDLNLRKTESSRVPYRPLDLPSPDGAPNPQ